MAGRVGRLREDGLLEYVARAKTRRRSVTVPLGQAAATESTDLARSAERGATPSDDELQGHDAPAGGEGSGRVKRTRDNKILWENSDLTAY